MLGKLFGDTAGGVIKAVAEVADEYFETDEEKRQFQERVEQRIAETNKAMIELNKQEAQHRSIFVAGWRPFVAWICGVAMGLKFIVFPLVVFAFALFGIEVIPPDIGWQELSVVLMGLLGLGGLRTVEKARGLTK